MDRPMRNTSPSSFLGMVGAGTDDRARGLWADTGTSKSGSIWNQALGYFHCHSYTPRNFGIFQHSIALNQSPSLLSSLSYRTAVISLHPPYKNLVAVLHTTAR